MTQTLTGKPERLSRNRDFLLWWSGSMVSDLGTGISGIAYPLLVLGATGSVTKAAVVGASFSLALAVFSLPAGVIADRYSRRKILILAPATELIAIATIVAALLSGHVWVAQLAAVALIQGAMTALRSAAARPAFRRIVPPGQIELALSRTLTGSGLTSLAAPPAGASLLALARWLPFAVDAVSFAASAVTAAMLRTPLGPSTKVADRAPLRTDLKEGFRFVWANHYLRFVAGWSCLLGSALASMPLVVVVLTRSRGAEPWLTGVVLTVGAVGGLLGAAASSWVIRRFRARLLVLTGSWAMVAAMAAAAVLPHPIQIGAAAGIAYFLVSPLIVVTNAYELRIVPDEYQGRVQTIMLMSELSILWIVLLIVGAVADALGPTASAIAVTALFAAAAILGNVTKALRALDETPEPAE